MTRSQTGGSARSVILIGPMGSGKTECAAALSKSLELPLIDTDHLVTSAAGKSIARIFDEQSEAVFRQLEREAVDKAVASAPAVVACGGGVVLDSKNVEKLRGMGTVIYLEVSAAEAARRVGAGTNRPLLAGKDVRGELARMMEVREPLYQAAAHIKVDGEGTVDQVSRRVLEALGKGQG